MKKPKPEEIICVAFILLIVTVVVFAFITYFSKQSRTERLVLKLATKNSRETNGPISEYDAWGNQLQSSYSNLKTKKTYSIISAGKDGQFNTADDISRTQTDYNKSKIIGKWVAKKSIEAVKGAKEAITENWDKKPEKFDDEEPTENKESFSKRLGQKIGSKVKDFKEGLKESKEIE